MILNGLRLYGLDVNEQFMHESLAKVPVMVDTDEALEIEKFSDQGNVVELFRDADYDVGKLFRQRLDDVVY